MIKFCLFSKNQCVPKTQNLMLISNPLEKLQKISCEKFFMKKWHKNGIFDFNYWVQKFSNYNIFRWFFALFQRILTKLLLTLKAKSDKTAQKTKIVFYKCVLESEKFYIYYRSGRLHFVKTSQNRCILLYSYRDKQGQAKKTSRVNATAKYIQSLS